MDRGDGEVVAMLVRSLLTGVLIAGVLSAPAAAAARGPLPDPSFGTNGSVVVDRSGGDGVRDLALQPDGRIVYIGNGDEGHFLVSRLLPDGRVDDSFGTVVTDVDPGSFW